MVWVRTRSTSDEGHELPAEASLSVDSLVAVDRAGPYVALADGVMADGRLRDALARRIATPSLRDAARMRWVVLGLAVVPALLLVELDRELAFAKIESFGVLVADLVVFGYVAFELTRKTPRFPGVAAAGLASIVLRWTLVITRLCAKDVRLPVWIALGLAIAATGVMLVRMPSRARIGYELLGKLGVSRADADAKLRGAIPTPSNGLVAAALAAAAALPLMLYVLRRAGADLWIQGISFIAYAVVVPEIVRRVFGLAREAWSPRRVALGMFAGLALTAALLHGAHWFFDAGNELARCTGKLDEEAKRLIAKEAIETSTGVARVRASAALVLMTTAFVPLAEERVYRALLMRTLVGKYGSAYGLFASAVVFGIAHVGAYEIALYQTVLLGLSFGVAYAEGGLLAAFVVHAAWNLLLLV